MPRFLPDEDLYENSLSVIAHGFKLRRADAMPRAIRQLKEWRSARKGALKRRDLPSSKRLRSHYRTLETLIRKNINRYFPRDVGFGATPELLAKPSRRDNILGLEEVGRISGEQAAAAREIQRIVEIITSGSQPKCQNYQKGSEGWRPGSFMTAETAYRWSCVYVPWHAAMGKRSDKRLKKLAIYIILDGISLDQARCRLKMSYERGHRYLTEALDLYIDIKEKGADHPARVRIMEEAAIPG